MAELIVTIHISVEKKVIAICDKELSGKKIEEGRRQLDLASSFYKGKLMGEKDILRLLQEECHLNAVGPNAIKFCKKNNLIDEKYIIVIGGVPHAESVLTN